MLPDYVSDFTYRNVRALNWSTLKHIAKSPKHYRHKLHNPSPDSAAYRLGRATHAAILEPDRFASDWTVYGGRRAGKAWQDFRQENQGLEVLNDREHEQATLMAKHVQESPSCAARLEDGWAERSIFWAEEVAGFAEPVGMKARLDWVYRDGDSFVLLDVKTARDITPRVFGSAAGRYLYHGQIAHYLAGLQRIVGGAPVRAELLVVETEQPYDCGVFKLDAAAIECGALRRAQMLTRLAECQAADHWPGVLDEPQWLELPEWELSILDDADVVVD